MSNTTFDKDGNALNRKEDTEWLRIWCEEVNDNSLPRVALIGDSITEGYYGIVKASLKGIARVDYLATSYSIVSDMYGQTVRAFIKDSKYDVVHYNYGLHGFSVSDESYGDLCRDFVRFFASESEIIIATTTSVLQNDCWEEKIAQRNKTLVSVAKEFDAYVNDLNSVSEKLDASGRDSDGVHFTESGYRALSQSVVKAVMTQLNKNNKKSGETL